VVLLVVVGIMVELVAVVVSTLHLLLPVLPLASSSVIMRSNQYKLRR